MMILVTGGARSGKSRHAEYSAANYLIPICILFDTDKKQTTANYLIPNPPLFDGF